MSDTIITVENISKSYLIGHRNAQRAQYVALRDVIARETRNFARKAIDLTRGRQIVQGDEVEEFWALRDVSFEVKRGEILGIIGGNGAGKSTLLKILSRITVPTSGRVVLGGRVASLLEVGTGFHRELTGRENVFLNGAILGMTQREIRKKFDEIVAFAQVEKFVDTPVKQYSSGMYMRLAFAVAAHLEPEILIVDEVLAVGDAEFQRKCMGKMDEVSRNEGRTVLFVSHNVEAILKLCTRGIFFESGCIRSRGDIKTVVPAYLSSHASSPKVVDLTSRVRPDHFRGKAQLVNVSASGVVGNWSLPFGQELCLDVTIDVSSSVTEVVIGGGIFSTRGFEVASWTSKCGNARLSVHPGLNTFRIGFGDLRLLPGQYSLGLAVHDGRDDDYIHEAVFFEMTTSPEALEINAQDLNGAIVASATVTVLA